MYRSASYYITAGGNWTLLCEAGLCVRHFPDDSTSVSLTHLKAGLVLFSVFLTLSFPLPSTPTSSCVVLCLQRWRTFLLTIPTYLLFRVILPLFQATNLRHYPLQLENAKQKPTESVKMPVQNHVVSDGRMKHALAVDPKRSRCVIFTRYPALDYPHAKSKPSFRLCAVRFKTSSLHILHKRQHPLSPRRQA